MGAQLRTLPAAPEDTQHQTTSAQRSAQSHGSHSIAAGASMLADLEGQVDHIGVKTDFCQGRISTVAIATLSPGIRSGTSTMTFERRIKDDLERQPHRRQALPAAHWYSLINFRYSSSMSEAAAKIFAHQEY